MCECGHAYAHAIKPFLAKFSKYNKMLQCDSLKFHNSFSCYGNDGVGVVSSLFHANHKSDMNISWWLGVYSKSNCKLDQE